ncbi:transient receptor potential cation channel protein painless [Drosophila bipectinata]|uniref:transient receptor potential cation channel protein painless n=1 Tax=Drosophila bipectinata TaxID=42026 RepID=UPI001C89FB38|nr:transient receptor potential cation channel protein painless [Drosophila bipectinata]
MDMTMAFLEPQAQLSAALERRQSAEFKTALARGAQAYRQDERHQSIFEKTLSTPGCGDFIDACIDHGCNVNYVNRHNNKAAVNYAADSRDAGNLEALLRPRGNSAKVQVDRKYANLTPLNSLAKNLTADNAADVRACMELLLLYGASPNAVDQSEFTPLHHVLRNKKVPKTEQQKLVELFLAQPLLDIDSYRNGQVRQLLQTQYPGLQLPEPSSGPLDTDQLQRTLRDCDEEQFLQQLDEYKKNLSSSADNQRNTNQEEYLALLEESIKRGKQKALEAILGTGVNINGAAGKPNQANVIEVAVISGNWQALERLLRHPQLHITSKSRLLNSAISRLEEQPYEVYCDYERCFKVLLASHLVDINETDKGGMTPLAYAVKYRNTWAIKELLQQGAYIGAKSKFGDLPIQDIAPELLQEHFDSCITTNGEKPGESSFEIQIDFKNLMRQEARESQALSHSLRDEMTPIAYIAKSKELSYLLQHPLISSFLFLKWHRLSLIFYLNFLIYSLFTASIIAYTLLKFHESEHAVWTGFFQILSWVGIGYLIVREAIQAMMSPMVYLKSAINWMEIALIVLSICTCIESTYDEETKRVLAVITILLVSMEFCLLVGSLPVLSISTHMLMLRAVSSSFVKSFALYSIFVLTFSLCFYILFGKDMPPIQDNAVPHTTPSPDANPKDKGEFNTFSKPIEALIKTIVMLTGEFDASEIKFTSIYTYLIFLLFVFFMTIVLFNLLNGLAVSDTQAIKTQAELNGEICRTNLLTRYELVLTGRHGRAGCLSASQPFRSIIQRLLNIYPNYLGLRQISVLPNDGNKVLIPTSYTFEAPYNQVSTNPTASQKKLLDPPLQLLPCCCSMLTGKCSQIDARTVKLALALIDQKTSTEQRRLREQQSDRRLQVIEQKLESLLQLLQERN